MPRRFVDIFGEGNRPRRSAGAARRSSATPSSTGGTPEPGRVAGADTDSESGAEGTDRKDQALRALQAMFDRGLIPEAAYRARRAEIEAGRVDPED